MKSKKYLRIAIYVVILAVFNLVYFFSGGTDRTLTVWLAYAFVYVAVIVSFVAPIYCINYKRIPENLSTIYGFAWLYTIISVGMNSIFILINLESVKFCIVINCILLTIYFIQLVINLNVNYAVEKKLENIEAERQFVRDTSMKLKMCMTMITEQEVRKAVEKAYDSLRTSPLHSNTEVMKYEVEIIRLAGVLESRIDNGDYVDVINIADEIVKNTKKRNALL